MRKFMKNQYLIVPKGKIIVIIAIISIFLILIKMVSLSVAVIAIINAREALAQNEISQALQDGTWALERAASEIRPFVPLFRNWGEDPCAVAELVVIGDEIESALQPLVQIASDVIESDFSQGVDLRPLSSHLNPQVRQQAVSHLDALIQRPGCPMGSSRLSQLLTSTRSALPFLRAFYQLDWPLMLQEDTRWLMVLNNTDELRATGGFTTALVDFQVRSGVLQWRLLNSYSVQNLERLSFTPLAPAPLRDMMGIYYWLFRDANWSPDHPEAAREQMRSFLLHEGPPEPSVFITLNLTALTTLFEFLPPVTTSDEIIDAASIADRVRARWNDDVHVIATDDPLRKNFIEDFAVELARAVVEQTSMVEKLRMIDALQAMLERRDLMIASSIPSVAEVMRVNGWDGGLVTVDQDYLMVVSSNVGYNKVTPRVEQQVTYAVDLDQLQAQVTLQYTNTNTDPVPCTMTDIVATRPQQTPVYWDRMIGCYWNYARVYFPEGGQVISHEAASVPDEWFPFSTFVYQGEISAWRAGSYPGAGALVVVPPASTGQLQFTYTLPASIISGDALRHYGLYIQAQAGAPASDYRIEVRLPAGAQFVDARPSPNRVEGQVVEFRLRGTVDQQIDVTYSP